MVRWVCGPALWYGALGKSIHMGVHCGRRHHMIIYIECQMCKRYLKA
jgi:hypothetical protein